MTLFGSLFHGNLSHSFLALAQRNIVKLPKVNSETQLPPWEHTTLYDKYVLMLTKTNENSYINLHALFSFRSLLNWKMHICVTELSVHVYYYSVAST